MDEASLLALCASSIYRHDGEVSVEEAISVAEDIINTVNANLRQRDADAAFMRRQPRQTRRAVTARPPVEDEEIPF
jgi:hypothetical protein